VRARASVPRLSNHDADTDVTHRFEHRLRPLSAGVAVPVFAFFAAGVTVVGTDLGSSLTDAVSVGVVAGLILGKLAGVFLGTWGISRFTRAELDDELSWWDVLGLSLLAGIGFTVSLLISELAFAGDDEVLDHAKLAVLLGSLLSAVLAALVLRRRNAVYREIERTETLDADGDGVPDCFEVQASAK
jgi:Na+:H+ antiporter, NhaA family